MSAIERRALRALGAPFRAQGRDVAHGLDCIGLVIYALAIKDAPAPDYRLGIRDAKRLNALILKWCRKVSEDEIIPGDMLQFALPGGRIHLAILSSKGIIHADLRRRAVVESPGMPPWPILGAFRRVSTTMKKDQN